LFPALALEYAANNIRLNTVSPGVIGATSLERMREVTFAIGALR
jgi:NAD(P)-dependent dehydrogenase (short-subunit alcohol dehydrogenase family)